MGLGNSKQWEFKRGYLYTITYQRVTFGPVRTATVIYEWKEKDGLHYFQQHYFTTGDNDNINIMNKNQPIKTTLPKLYEKYFGEAEYHSDIGGTVDKSYDLYLWDNYIIDVYEGLKQEVRERAFQNKLKRKNRRMAEGELTIGEDDGEESIEVKNNPTKPLRF